MMADFGMRIVDAAINLAVEDQADSDAGADSDVNQARFVAACAPTRLTESGGVRIILDGHADLKSTLEIFDGIFPVPVGEEIDITDLAGQRINRTGGTNADSRDFLASFFFGGSAACAQPRR